MLALLPALVVVAGVGGYFIARRAFRPVTRIARTAESIIDGKDLQKRIGLQGARDELYRLSKVFDDMLDRLERSFERERRFTSDASHELRTPVAAILAQADFALSDIANEEDREEALRDIRLRAGQMSTLIGRLLALTRMDAGQTRMELERIDLADIAEVAAMQVEEGAAARGMTVECAVDGPVWAMCDQTMLTQALLNLAENAVKYGREGGHIRIAARAEGETARLIVEDDGPGIEPDALPHIFERFYQGDRSRNAGGAGLGLSLVQLIAKLHGGSVEGRKRAGRGQPLYHRPAAGAGGTRTPDKRRRARPGEENDMRRILALTLCLMTIFAPLAARAASVEDAFLAWLSADAAFVSRGRDADGPDAHLRGGRRPLDAATGRGGTGALVAQRSRKRGKRAS